MSKEHDIDIMTKTLWMEARGEPDEGIQAVACVIYNRYISGKWYSRRWGIRSIANTCLKKGQFSCWNPGDQCDTKLPKAKTTTEAWNTCAIFARLAVEGLLPDIVDGADHYHAITMKKKPDWAKSMKVICQIGNHRFYRDDNN